MAAAFLAISVPVFIITLFVGSVQNLDWVITAGYFVAPVMGLGLPYAWTKLRRRAAPGQSSPYQAVYAAAIDVGLSGEPADFTLAFENPRYGRQFVALNQDAGVIEVGPNEGEGVPQLNIGQTGGNLRDRRGPK